MEVEGMEIESEAHQAPIGDSPKRFGLRSSIQTNFGEDYVFQIVSKDESMMGVSLSTNVIKFYSPTTAQYLGQCSGHNGTINEISFADGLNSNLLHSCSSDGTIRIWDVRSFQQVAVIGAGSSQEVFSLSVGGPGNNLLAAGCEAQVHVWDWRNQKRIASLEESHMEDVTQVHFVPGHENKLISASVDGLICVFDTASDINEDDHLESVLNVGTSIGKIGFFGETNQLLWCLTHIETLSLWDWKNAEAGANFQNARSLASASSQHLENVDYFIDCIYSNDDDNLIAIAGTNDGAVGYFPVSYRGTSTIESPIAVLNGGHVGIVRTVLPVSQSGNFRPSQGHGIFGWTGGEDGRLCCWVSHESNESARSWMSSELVIKTHQNRCKRHRPY